MYERIVNIISAIILLIVISIVLKVVQYFGYDIEPNRQKGWKYQIEQQKQKKSDAMVEHIATEYLRNK